MRFGFSLLLYLCVALQEDSCADNPTSEMCRDETSHIESDASSFISSETALPVTQELSSTAASSASSSRKSTKENTKNAVQTAETPLELLSPARAFTGENNIPLSATAVMSIRMPRNMVLVAPSPGSRARPHKRLFLQLLLQASGNQLMIYDALEGDLLLDTTTLVDISIMKVAGDRVAIAYKDNSIRVFKVVAIGEEPELLPGQKKKKGKDTVPPTLRLKLESEAEVTPYVRQHISNDTDLPVAAETLAEVPRTLTALSVHVGKGRLQWLLGGYEDGLVVSFTKDGSAKAQIETNSSVVAFTPGQGNFVVAVNKQGYGLVRVSSKSSPVTMFCNHTNNGTGIHDMVYDPSSSSLLYAVTEKGRLLVFNTKASRDINIYCRPKHTVIVEEGSYLNLAITRGFLLITSPSALYIYNLTVTRSEAPTFTLRRAFLGEAAPLPSFIAPASLQPPLSLHVLLRETTDEYIAVSQLSSGEAIMFISHLPFTEESKGSTMYRLPIILGGLVAMAFFQIYKKRKAPINMNDPIMRELREMGIQNNRINPRGVKSGGGGGGNRRFGLTGRKFPPPRRTESPAPILEENDDDITPLPKRYQSDPEESDYRGRSALLD